jgi:hypothetical protein
VSENSAASRAQTAKGEVGESRIASVTPARRLPALLPIFDDEGGVKHGSDGTRTRDLRRDRPRVTPGVRARKDSDLEEERADAQPCTEPCTELSAPSRVLAHISDAETPLL